MAKNTPAADVAISHDLIHALLAEFVPELADEPLTMIGSGWDNEIHRVGETHAVRLPRRAEAAVLVENEQQWLPEIEGLLPVEVPTPIYAGKPAFGYPWHWSVVPWLKGVPVAHAQQLDPSTLMEDLAAFLNALHVPADPAAPRNPFRGTPLHDRTASFMDNVEHLEPEDRAPTVEVWESLVDTPEWGGDPVWLHGDLHPLNILVRAGRVRGVIDFGDITAGDPATDIAVAWMVFDHDQRQEFRRLLTIDGKSVGIHTWNRARAWALSLATAYLAHSADDPTLRRIGRRTLDQALA